MLDLNARNVIGGVPLSGVPTALAVSADGGRVYAARKNAIEIVDGLAIRKLGQIALAGTPIDIAVTGTRGIVVQAGGKLAVLDLAANRVVRRVKLEGASGVSVDAEGRAWVSATTPRKGKHKPEARLVRVTLESGSIAASVKLGTDGGGGVGVAPDGSRAIVAPGAKLAGVHRKAVVVDLVQAARRRPPRRRAAAPAARRSRPTVLRVYVADAGGRRSRS